MPQPTLIPLAWPLKGLVENTSYQEQPEGTTTDALNVRCFDSFERRNRGGQRTGIDKFIESQVNGSNDLQLISTMTEAVALSEGAGFESKYANPSSLPSNNAFEVAFHPDGDVIVCVTQTSATAYRITSYNWSEVSGFGSQIQSLAVTSVTAGDCHVEFNDDGTALMVFIFSATNTATHNKIYPFSKVTGAGVAVNFPAIASIANATGWVSACWHPDGDIIFIGYNAVTTNRTSVSAYTWTGAALVALSAVTHASLTNTSPHVGCAPNGSGVVVGSVSRGFTWAFDRVGGFTGGTDLATGTIQKPAFSVDSAEVAFTVTTSVEVRTFSSVTGLGSAVTQAVGLGNTLRVRFSPSGDYLAVGATNTPFVKVYPWTGAFGTAIADPSTLPAGAGNGVFWAENERVIAVAHNTTPFLSVYGFQAATVNPSARRQRLIAVAGGNVYRSTVDLDLMVLANSGSGALNTSGVVRGVEAFQRFFFCNAAASGYKYLDYADNTVKTWTPLAGTLPVGTVDATTACRIIALYRGRVVLSGLLEEPQNWFMSAAGDPFNWDYSPATPSPTQAVAGNNSEVGQLGEVVTCLAPFQDDVMIMGGVNSLWIMRGDPAAGGQIDNLSRQIGIVGPDAYAWDTTGNFYFFGQNGLYKLAQNSNEPICISKGRLDTTFAGVNTKENRVWLVYDAIWQGVHIFIIPTSEPTTGPRHYYWDERNDSFWVDQYPATIGPTCVHLFQADDPDMRGLLMGGFDGYIRQFSDTSASDDGTAIDSFVRFSPINPGSIVASSRIEDMQLVLDEDSDDVTMKVFTGSSVEDAEDAADSGSARLKRILKGGRNSFIRERIAQNAMIVQLSQNENSETWAYEQGMVRVSVLDRMKGRNV